MFPSFKIVYNHRMIQYIYLESYDKELRIKLRAFDDSIHSHSYPTQTFFFVYQQSLTQLIWSYEDSRKTFVDPSRSRFDAAIIRAIDRQVVVVVVVAVAVV